MYNFWKTIFRKSYQTYVIICLLYRSAYLWTILRVNRENSLWALIQILLCAFALVVYIFQYICHVVDDLLTTLQVFTLFRAFLYAYGGIRAATVLHQKLLGSILKASVLFFDTNPVSHDNELHVKVSIWCLLQFTIQIGRIVNRFSSDLVSRNLLYESSMLLI